ncbi:PREDICTED: red-sensitive opsin-like [Ficedula albicollis]|uniref:red-sensitive opsin-like n=1 Tax=Ficedula albicollis TaxID=59894 RepID=UPI0007AD8271|nr:PREDICTED: red-sensitive opsin-like [Ficedula albicollis]
MQKAREMRDELPEDFYIPVSLETTNLTALSPFLVPQTHLGSPGIFRAMAAFMFLLVVLGAPVNALTVLCTAKYKKLRSHLNYILVNLAVANLLVVCVGSTTAFYSFSQMYFALGPLACKIEGFTATLGGITALWSLAIISWERWFVVCKPFGNIKFDGKLAMAGVVFAWVWACAWTAPPIFGWSRYWPHGLKTSCGPDVFSGSSDPGVQSYMVVLMVTCCFFPLSVIIFCYLQVWLAIRAVRTRPDMGYGIGDRNRVTIYSPINIYNPVCPRCPRVCPCPPSVPSLSVCPSAPQFRNCILQLFGKKVDDGSEVSTSRTEVSSVSNSSVSPA